MFQVEGVDYSPEGIEDVRQEVIRLRNEAMDQAAWEWVALLSHCVALLAGMKELVESGTDA